jgi:hypothetical protein
MGTRMGVNAHSRVDGVDTSQIFESKDVECLRLWFVPVVAFSISRALSSVVLLCCVDETRRDDGTVGRRCSVYLLFSERHTQR